MPSLTAIAGVRQRFPRLTRGVLELVLVLVLWLGYSLSRLLADTAMKPALQRAHGLLHIEKHLGLHWEIPLNQLFSAHDVLGLLGSYWYAALHYVVTFAVLVWLYLRGRHTYLPARRALAIATILGLVIYLMLPTAPPRFLGGYVDVLDLHAAAGWWGTDASAPRGLGGLTNQLAAFPSLHAGWALWCAIALHRHARWSWVKVLGWLYAVGTAVVIVGTGNHWVLDVLVGWLVIVTGFMVADGLPVRADRDRRGRMGPPDGALANRRAQLAVD